MSERRSRFWLLEFENYVELRSGLLNDAEEEDYETEDVSYTTTTSTTLRSILIAILKWSKFVDKFFEGAEPCPICYQVLAKSNGRKPEATCRQCSNSYHGDCSNEMVHCPRVLVRCVSVRFNPLDLIDCCEVCIINIEYSLVTRHVKSYAIHSLFFSQQNHFTLEHQRPVDDFLQSLQNPAATSPLMCL